MMEDLLFGILFLALVYWISNQEYRKSLIKQNYIANELPTKAVEQPIEEKNPLLDEIVSVRREIQESTRNELDSLKTELNSKITNFSKLKEVSDNFGITSAIQVIINNHVELIHLGKKKAKDDIRYIAYEESKGEKNYKLVIRGRNYIISESDSSSSSHSSYSYKDISIKLCNKDWRGRVVYDAELSGEHKYLQDYGHYMDEWKVYRVRRVDSEKWIADFVYLEELLKFEIIKSDLNLKIQATS